MAKGIVQHVFPFQDGWAVYEAWKPDTIYFFEVEDEAIGYAQNQSQRTEGHILLCNEAPLEVLEHFVMLRPVN